MTERTSADRRIQGIAAYLGITFVLSWLPALVVRDLWSLRTSHVVYDLAAGSLLYALTMGWQPLVATWMTRRWVENEPADNGMRRPTRGYLALASFGPLLLALGASIVAWAVGLASLAGESATPVGAPSWATSVTLAGAMVVAVVLIWVQAFAEEVGWRGYFLTRLMEQVGPTRGLLLHGLAWGVWYAPVLLAGANVGEGPGRFAIFAVTCALLGGLLGWLRLASGSVLASATANAVLTASAGLPLLLGGFDVGLRGAIYGPAGWVPMGLLLAAVLVGPCRRAVRLRNGAAVEKAPPEVAPRPSVLH